MNASMNAVADAQRQPMRLGFLGVGWIGRNRMEAMIDTGAVDVAAIMDPSAEQAASASALAPGSRILDTLDDVLALGLDGIVIATPSALHAEQAIQALEKGVAVFCQKPLGRSAAEVAAVIEAARRNDRLLGVDMSYRHTAAARKMAELVRSGEIGEPFSIELKFHNAYGPDKPWFYDRSLSGGGCVIDLGVHLIDLALWCLDFPKVKEVRSALFKDGKRLRNADDVETSADAFLELENGAVIQLACSWKLHAGQDAVIGATVHGSRGGVAITNVGGSFYDFAAYRFDGTRTETLVSPPDEWGGRAAAEWAGRLGSDPSFDPTIAELEDVAAVIDRIYGR